MPPTRSPPRSSWRRAAGTGPRSSAASPRVCTRSIFKDHVGTRSVGIGRGEIDLAAIVATLRDVRYAGGLTIELEVEDTANLPRYTEEAFVYTSGLLGTKI